MTYGKRTLIAVDQLLNTLLGGWPDETLSSRCYRWARDGVRGAVGCQARFRRGAMGHVGQCGSGGIVAPVARGVCTGGRALGVRLA